MVNTEHPAVSAVKAKWQRCRDCFAGGDAVKARQTEYLPWSEGMDRLGYIAYLTRAVFLSVFLRTVAALAGAILRRPPRISAPDWLLPQLDDVTLRDESLTSIARALAHEVLTVGRVGVLLDMPLGPGGRPYWTVFEAEDIVNWREQRIGADPVRLVQLVLREHGTTETEEDPFAHVATERYRECALVDAVYQVRVWTRTAAEELSNPRAEHWTAGDWITPLRRGQPLSFIPFVFIGPTGTTSTVEQPPNLALADMNLAHYRNSADREHGLFYTALPTPWVAGAMGDAQLKIGPAAAWRLGENGKAGMLEFTGAGLAAIEKAMREKELHMAGLGARLLEHPRTNDTATAVLVRHAGETASLRTIASAIGAALTTLTRWHTWWAAGIGDIDTNVRVDIADDLDRVRLTSQDVQTAMGLVQSDLMSFDSFYALLEQGNWTRPGISAQEEQHAIVAALRMAGSASDNDDNNDAQE